MIEPKLSEKDLPDFRRTLLRWYRRNRRDLPWRKTGDPYRIWLSEIMLQQTRVAAVLDHYRLFLQRFPNVQALAEASEAAVLAAWSGLGYYRRARMLHRCAHEVVAKYGSKLPQTSESLRALPGIGPYTAAAVASIAFNEPTAVVDGNVERVVQRMAGGKLASPEIWTQAQRLLSRTRPGDFNQGMMELGARICLPRRPDCEGCPIRKWCVTRGELPLENSKSRQTRKEIWCSLERRDGQIRLRQRSKRASLMAGMWELPQASGPRGEKLLAAHWRTFRHSITTTNYTVHVVRRAPAKEPGRWIAINKIPELPITGLTRKILKADGII